MSLSFNGKEVNKVKFNNSDVNYVIKDGKLVWANPNLYLKSSGTQYIDSRCNPTNNCSAEYQFILPNVEDNIGYGIAGVYEAAGGDIYFGIKRANYTTLFYRYDNNFVSGITPIQSNTKYSVNVRLIETAQELKINGVTEATSQYTSNNSTVSYYLFKIRNLNEIIPPKLIMYQFKLYNKNDVLIQHFVPVPAGLKIGDYTVPSNGMWDIVSQQFFGNSGTGEFGYGKDN